MHQIVFSQKMMQRYADDYHNLAEEFKAYRNRAEENEQNMQNSLEGEKSRLNTNISSLERERNNLRDELESKRKDIEVGRKAFAATTFSLLF